MGQTLRWLAGSEFHLRYGLGCFGYFEVSLFFETERSGKEIRGEAFDGDVVGSDRLVIASALGCNTIFRPGKFVGEANKLGIRLELRIGLGNRQQARQSARELIRRIDLLGAAPGADQLGSRLSYRCEDFFFLSGVTFGCLDQIGNQVVAPLELVFDLGPGGIDGLPLLNHRIVATAGEHRSQQECQRREKGGISEFCRHNGLSVVFLTISLVGGV